MTMGLGSTAQKLQVMAERAEQVYSQIMELREQIAALRETVEHTGDRVEEIDLRTEKQSALITAIAEEQGIDVDAVLTEAAIEDADEAPDPDPTQSDSEAEQPDTPSDGEP